MNTPKEPSAKINQAHAVEAQSRIFENGLGQCVSFDGLITGAQLAALFAVQNLYEQLEKKHGELAAIHKETCVENATLCASKVCVQCGGPVTPKPSSDMVDIVRTWFRCGQENLQPNLSALRCADALESALAEIAALREDKARLDWILPVLELADLPAEEKNERTFAIAGSMMQMKSGREAIDAAMNK